MALWTVHIKDKPEDAVFVREGFSWPAFVFGPVWLFFKRMWLVCGVVIILMILIAQGASLAGLPKWTASLLSLGLSLILGFEGHDLLRWSLGRRGFGGVGVVGGEDAYEAELRYFETLPAAPRPAPAAAPAAAGWPDPLGLFSR